MYTGVDVHRLALSTGSGSRRLECVNFAEYEWLAVIMLVLNARLDATFIMSMLHHDSVI